MLQKAQEYLSKGYSVIPVGTDKKPLIKWTEYQTRKAEETEVQQWLQQFPNMQLGIVTGAISDLVVIDVEEGGDHTQFPETLTATTGGNGYHLYYKHPGTPVKNGVKVMELVDIRGDGGYVVAPGSSSTKGAYDWVEETTEPALYTGDMLQSQPEMPLETGELVQIGERNVLATKKAGEILAYMPHAHSRNDAWALLQQWNETEVAEPLPNEELMKVFTSIAGREDSKPKAGELVLNPFTLKELYNMKFPPIEWLAQDLLPTGMLGAITGESNCYKSFLTLDLAQAIATGTPFLGHFKVKQGKVLIVDEENNRRIIEKRFKDMGVEAHENIIFLSQTGVQLDNKDHLMKLKKAVDKINPVLVVLDSLVRFHHKDENSATEMGKVMESMRSLVTEERSVVFIHHHKKEQGGARNSGSGSVRGSTDIFNALHFHLGIKKNTDTIVVQQHKLRVQQELAPFNVTISTGIINDDIEFVYGGEDTSRKDHVTEIKSAIEELLHGAAGEELTRKEITDDVKTTNKVVAEALKELEKEETISYRTGAHGAHFYKIGAQIEEQTLDEEEN